MTSPWVTQRQQGHGANDSRQWLLHVRCQGCSPAALHPKTAIFPLTSQAAAIGRIYFSAIYFESPAPGDVHIGGFFDIDYIWGSGARDAKEVGDISTIETSLKQRKSKFHRTSLLWESISALLCPPQ